MFFRAREGVVNYQTMRDLVSSANAVLSSLNQYISNYQFKILNNESNRAVDVKNIASLVYGAFGYDKNTHIDAILSTINLSSKSPGLLVAISNFVEDDPENHKIIGRFNSAIEDIGEYLQSSRFQTGWMSSSQLRGLVKAEIDKIDLRAYKNMYANYLHSRAFFSSEKLSAHMPLNSDLVPEKVKKQPQDVGFKSLSRGKKVKDKAELPPSTVYFLFYTSELGKTNHAKIQQLLLESFKSEDFLKDHFELSVKDVLYKLVVRENEQSVISRITAKDVDFALIRINESYHDVQEMVINKEYSEVCKSVATVKISRMRDNEITEETKFHVERNARTNNFRFQTIDDEESVKAVASLNKSEVDNVKSLAELARRDARQKCFVVKNIVESGAKAIEMYDRAHQESGSVDPYLKPKRDALFKFTSEFAHETTKQTESRWSLRMRSPSLVKK